MMQENPRAIALIHSAAHLSPIAGITNSLSRITAEECNQFGCFSLLTRLTCECYRRAHSRERHFWIPRQVFDHVDFFIERLSSNAGEIVAYSLVSHSVELDLGITPLNGFRNLCRLSI